MFHSPTDQRIAAFFSTSLSSRNNRTSLRRRGCFLSQHPHAAPTSDHRADIVEPTCSASRRQPLNPMKAVDALRSWSLPSALHHAETRLCIFFAIPYLLHSKHCSKETGTKTGQDQHRSLRCVSDTKEFLQPNRTWLGKT